MWLITITCTSDAWKQMGTQLLAIADKYSAVSVSSKKMPDGERTMQYKIEDVSDAESFQDECEQLEGFTASFESL